MNVGYLQHPAILQDSCTIGRGDGKGMCILAEQLATAEQLQEWVEPMHHRDRTEAGFQMALPFPARRVCPNT